MKKRKQIKAPRTEKMTIEVSQRATRVWEYVERLDCGVTIKNVREDMGLSYRQARQVLNLLVDMQVLRVKVTPVWNGVYYIHPHRYSIA